MLKNETISNNNTNTTTNNYKNIHDTPKDTSSMTLMRVKPNQTKVDSSTHRGVLF